MTDEARLEQRINELAAIGGTGTSMTRLGLSAEEERARELVASWCTASGATMRRDGAAVRGAVGPAAVVCRTPSTKIFIWPSTELRVAAT